MSGLGTCCVGCKVLDDSEKTNGCFYLSLASVMQDQEMFKENRHETNTRQTNSCCVRTCMCSYTTCNYHLSEGIIKTMSSAGFKKELGNQLAIGSFQRIALAKVEIWTESSILWHHDIRQLPSTKIPDWKLLPTRTLTVTIALFSESAFISCWARIGSAS